MVKNMGNLKIKILKSFFKGVIRLQDFTGKFFVMVSLMRNDSKC